MHTIKKILVVSKSTKECKKAFHNGVSLAKAFGAELTILHVIYDPFGLKGEGLPIPILRDYHVQLMQMMQSVKQDLDAMIKAEQAEGMHIKEIVVEGEPAKTIIKTIQEEGTDLMIMAAHEEDRIEHFLFSRDNYKLVRAMPCSLMFVKVEPF
jgi:nucleotide-binding universal stress UspA family protein